MEPKLTPEQAEEMLAHIELLFQARLLTEQEVKIFRDALKYARWTVVVIKASPRVVIGTSAFLASLLALKAYWPSSWSF